MYFSISDLCQTYFHRVQHAVDGRMNLFGPIDYVPKFGIDTLFTGSWAVERESDRNPSDMC